MKKIPMAEIQSIGINLFKLFGNALKGGITVTMYGAKMVIKEGSKEVFHMKTVKVIDDELWVDYPKAVEGEDGRGWGILGMLLALYYGRNKGCTKVVLGSEIELDSFSFWSKFGISNLKGTALSTALAKGEEWVTKTDKDNEGCFSLRDKKTA